MNDDTDAGSIWCVCVVDDADAVCLVDVDALQFYILPPPTTRYLGQKSQKSSHLLQVSSSPCDLLALILGARSRRETVKATDEIEDDAIRTVKMQMRGWIVVDIKDVFDLKAGTFNKEWMKKSVRDREGNEDFLGFLRIRWMNFR